MNYKNPINELTIIYRLPNSTTYHLSKRPPRHEWAWTTLFIPWFAKFARTNFTRAKSL